jgi:hypothetical protein
VNWSYYRYNYLSIDHKRKPFILLDIIICILLIPYSPKLKTLLYIKMAIFWVVAIALMMEAARTYETLVNSYQTTRRYNPDDSHLHTHHRENLKSYLLYTVLHSQYNLNWLQVKLKQTPIYSNMPLIYECVSKLFWCPNVRKRTHRGGNVSIITINNKSDRPRQI